MLREGCLSLFERLGWRSLRSAFASIWRMRSRVTLNSLPTSSSVLALPSSKPKRNLSTFFSLGVRESSTSISCSLSSVKAATSAGAGVTSSAIKSPRWLSSSSPIGVSRETGSCATFIISRTFSSDMPISAAISSGLGSRPYSCKSWRFTRISLFMVSTICTGILIVRA